MTTSARVGFLVWDDAGGLFLRVELTRTPEPSVATAAVLAWVGARPVYAFGSAIEPAGDATDGSVTVGGLRAAETGAGVWQLELDDGPNRLALRSEPFTAEVPFDLPAAPAPAAEHRESACRVSGAVELSGHAIAVDGVGQLRHTTDAGALPAAGWRAATGYLGSSSRPVGGPATDLAFSVWELPADGTSVVGCGFVHAGDTDHRIESVEAVGGDPWHLSLAVAGGRRYTVRGHPHGADVPVRPAGAGPAAVLHHQLVRWEAEGLDGYGLVERLEHLEHLEQPDLPATSV